MWLTCSPCVRSWFDSEHCMGHQAPLGANPAYDARNSSCANGSTRSVLGPTGEAGGMPGAGEAPREALNEPFP